MHQKCRGVLYEGAVQQSPHLAGEHYRNRIAVKMKKKTLPIGHSDRTCAHHRKWCFQWTPAETQFARSLDVLSRASRATACIPDGSGHLGHHFLRAVAQLCGRDGVVHGGAEGRVPPGGRGFAAAATPQTEDGAVGTDTTPGGESGFDKLWKSRRASSGLPSGDWRTGGVPLEQQKVLQVGVIGVPNAGKSTLTNQLIGSKVSAVSPKTNTTAVPMLGAFTEGVAQVVLHDTPGVVDSRHYKSSDQRQRVRSAWTTAQDCDMLLLIVDIHRQVDVEDPRIARLVEELATGKDLGDHPPPAVLLLNKIDKVERQLEGKAQSLASNLEKLHSFEKTFWVSAAKGYGIPDLREYLLSNATLGHWILNPDQATDMTHYKLAAEPMVIAMGVQKKSTVINGEERYNLNGEEVQVVREKLFRRLRQELPYEINIILRKFVYVKDGSLFYRYTISVPSETVRRMVIGKKGAVIGEIGITARAELSVIFKTKVHLYLDVKVE